MPELALILCSLWSFQLCPPCPQQHFFDPSAFMVLSASACPSAPTFLFPMLACRSESAPKSMHTCARWLLPRQSSGLALVVSLMLWWGGGVGSLVEHAEPRTAWFLEALAMSRIVCPLQTFLLSSHKGRLAQRSLGCRHGPEGVIPALQPRKGHHGC